MKLGIPSQPLANIVTIVNLKLRSLDDQLDRDILFSERIGLLSIEVGRASKNVARAMLPARGNVWVQSPVMSRNHAVISIDPESGQVKYAKSLLHINMGLHLLGCLHKGYEFYSWHKSERRGTRASSEGQDNFRRYRCSWQSCASRTRRILPEAF
jgi:hypothetical protein